MDAENWVIVKKTLREALDAPASERLAILESCSSSEVRAEVESLLALEDESADFLSVSIPEFSKDFVDSPEDSEVSPVGQKLGVYEIKRELGIGGMGAVYLASRVDGKFTQEVAIKMLRRELNVGIIRKNFGREREILSKLKHPNIATLLDAGTTPDGVPYLVMEYVEGVPIDVFCSTNKLDLSQRLDLFRKVCTAVDFAHRNLVVHRDLKPSNILVNAEGVPKLLDFGISKVLSDGLDQLSSATVTRLGVMTPSYASPEQLQNQSVTTATDIYSLGVILYELLSGHRPFETKEDDLNEIYKAVLEAEPERPSSVVIRPLPGGKNVTSENDLTRTAESGRASRFLSGDLDNIVLKALRKEPERRYSSAENLAEDVHRHQRGLPVTARPLTITYRAEKFFKRNKATVIGGILLMLAIFAGLIATLWQAQLARAERDRARLEAAKSEVINGFLQNVLNLSNPFWMSANPDSSAEATISQALDEAAQKVETDLAGQTEIQAEVHFTLGKTYMGQGKLEKAQAQLEKALDKFNQVSPQNSSKPMQVRLILNQLIAYQLTEADTEQSFTEIVEYFRANLNNDPENRKWLAMSLSDLAIAVARKGKMAESEAFFRQSLENGAVLAGNDRWIYVQAMGDLGDVLIEQGRTDEAITLYKSAIDEGGKLSDKPRPEIATSYYDLGRVYKRLGKYEEAQENIQKAYEIFKVTIGQDTVQTSMTRKQIAELYYLRGDYANARAEIDEVLRVIRKVVPDRPNLYELYAEEVLANILTKTGGAENAEKLMREVLSSYLRLLKSPNADIATARQSLGEALIAQKRFPEAHRVLTEAEKEFVQSVGEDDPQTNRCREILAKIPQ